MASRADSACAGGALEGVVAGLAAAVEEGPVARLHGEQLACGPGRGARGQAARERPQQAQLEPPRGPGDVGDRRRVPGAQVLALAPGRGCERPRDGARARRAPGAPCTSRTPAPPRRRRPPPRARPPPPTTSGRAARCRSRRRAARAGRARRRNRAAARRRRSRNSLRLAAGRLGGRDSGRRRRRRPSRSGSRAAICRRTGRGRGRTGSRPATRASSTASQSIGSATGPASVAIGVSASSGPAWALWSTQNQRTPCSARPHSSPGSYAHSGSQKPPSQPKRLRCERMPAST